MLVTTCDLGALPPLVIVGMWMCASPAAQHRHASRQRQTQCACHPSRTGAQRLSTAGCLVSVGPSKQKSALGGSRRTICVLLLLLLKS